MFLKDGLGGDLVKIFYLAMAVMLLYLAGYIGLCYHLYFRPARPRAVRVTFAGSFSLAQAVGALSLHSTVRH